MLVIGTTAQTYPAEPLHDGASPTITGDQDFKDNVQQAMDYLEASYPEDYKNVTFWLTEIHPTDTYTRVNNYGVCYVNANDSDASYYWLAGVLIHEAQHVADDDTYFIDNIYTPEESEHRALTVQAAYLAAINSWTQAQADYWINGWMDKRYWETIPKEYGQ